MRRMEIRPGTVYAVPGRPTPNGPLDRDWPAMCLSGSQVVATDRPNRYGATDQTTTFHLSVDGVGTVTLPARHRREYDDAATVGLLFARLRPDGRPDLTTTFVALPAQVRPLPPKEA